MKPTAERQQGASFDLHRDKLNRNNNRLSQSLMCKRRNRPRLWYHAYVSTSDCAFLEETGMAEQEKEAYLALIAAQDPDIRALLDQGFEFVTNAFKAGAAPSGIKARTDREHVRRLQQEGYQVEVTAAYDEQGQLRPSLSAIWRKKP
jgi:hypothetical protein